MNGINLAMWILAVDEWKFASLRFLVLSPNRPGLSRQNHIYPRTTCGGADRSGEGEWWPDTGPCPCPWAPPPRRSGYPAQSSPGCPAPWTDNRHNIDIDSVPDPNPDPRVFWPPGSGSGSFYHHAKIIRKILNPTILWLCLTFYLGKIM